jgi:N-acetylneuraminate synthase
MKEKIFLVAEVAQAHEGSLGIAHSYIDALAATGVDAVKFQTHIAQAESSALEPFRVKFSYEDESRFDYWKRMEFTPTQWRELSDHCHACKLEFLSSPFSVAAVSLLEELNVKRYKVGSGELSNFLMLDRIARTGKEIILSSGMSAWAELDETIQFLKPYGNKLTLLQCTTAYPTKPHQWGLNVMQKMRERYGLKVGFSDHSGNIYAGLAAVALGAEVLEFHSTFDQRMFGPDAKASLTIQQVSDLVAGVRQIEESLRQAGNQKDSDDQFKELKIMFGKSLAVNCEIKKGVVIKEGMLESKKPAGQGISTRDFKRVIGKIAIRDLPAWSFLKEEDIQ